MASLETTKTGNVTLVTDTFVLSVQGTRYSLRQSEVQGGPDAWTEARNGDLTSASISAFPDLEEQGVIQIQLNERSIGSFNMEDRVQTAALKEIVTIWNSRGMPTSLTTAKTALIVGERQNMRAHRDLKVQCLTWNTNGRLATFPCDVWGRCLRSESDIIALGFQETDVLGQNLVSNANTLASAKSAIGTALSKTHTIVASNQLLGLMSLVYVKKDLAETAGQVTYASSGTGFLGMWGNKGAVLIRFTLLSDKILGGGAEFSFINCHLSAGEDQGLNNRRRWELSEISSKFDIPGLALTDVERFTADASEFEADDLVLYDEEEESIDYGNQADESLRSMGNPSKEIKLEDTESPNLNKELPLKPQVTVPHSPNASPIAFLMGDLNYRIKLDDSTARKYVEKSLFHLLLRHDGLTREHRKHSVLGGFLEPDIRFPPTFKYGLGSNHYVSRVPSYTDRVFYRTNLPTQVNCYDSLREHLSDHLPVELGTTITVNCWDVALRAKATQAAIRMVDAADNRMRVRLEVEPLNLEVEGPVLSTVSAWLVIKSPVPRVVKWSVIHGPLVTVSPDHGTLAPGIRQIRLLVKAPLNLEQRVIEDVLIVRPEQGFDQFVTVKFSIEPTILGMSLSELCERSHELAGGAPNMPLQIWACTDYLWTRIVPNMFTHRGEPSIRQEVLRWLYNNTPFDLELLDKANTTGTNAGIYSVFDVLLTILKHLPEPLLTRQHVADFRTSNDVLDHLDSTKANLVIYLVGFYRHALVSGVRDSDARSQFLRMLFGKDLTDSAEENRMLDSLLA